MSRSLPLGYTVLILAQIAISINVVTGKTLVAQMPMFLILTARFAISTLLLGMFMKISRTPLVDPQHPLQRLTLNDWYLGFLQGLFAAVLFNLFFLWGLQHTTATAAGIVGSTLPALVAISAVWFLKEKLNQTKVMAIMLAMIGILVINFDALDVNPNLDHSYFGDFLIFIAMLPEAWYSIVSRKLAQRVTPLGAAFLANAVGFLGFLPFALFTVSYSWSDFTWPLAGLILISASTSLLFFWGWGWGLTFIPASTAAIFGGVLPLSTTLLAIVFLGETLKWYDVLGIALVISSIVMGTGFQWKMRQRKGPTPRSAPTA